MKIITDNELLEQIERFMAKHDMKPSRFGIEAMGDGALIPQLRAGRSLTLKNARRIASFMATYRPSKQATAA